MWPRPLCLRYERDGPCQKKARTAEVFSPPGDTTCGSFECPGDGVGGRPDGRVLLSLSFLDYAALLDAGFFAGKVAEVVEFSATHFTIFVDGNRVDKR